MDPICGPPSSMRMRAAGCSSRTCRATAAPISPLPTMSTSHSASFLCTVRPFLVIRPAVPHARASLRVLAECGVERGRGKLPQEGADEPLCLLRPVKPIHTRVLPLHGDRPVVSDLAQGREGVLPWHVAQTLQAVPVEDVQPALDVGVVLGGMPDVQVLPGAGDLQTVIAPPGGKPGDLLEWEVGPLAREEGDWLRRH